MIDWKEIAREFRLQRDAWARAHASLSALTCSQCARWHCTGTCDARDDEPKAWCQRVAYASRTGDQCELFEERKL